ncbi:CYFA0S02e03092g1_1 [Cyberlindnera fabianii]|uniref:CYFA0S02e03092g1_1 n=1 Tax=Cyberlindnera fabianii TaxID=36022 RepID=A0A061AT89_CYBFA|nr:CYFA0S02e03092g1_1 [Cyberlindnera fabianii]
MTIEVKYAESFDVSRRVAPTMLTKSWNNKRFWGEEKTPPRVDRIARFDLKTSKMSDEGASYREQLLDAARRNNSDLFATIAEALDTGKLSSLINEARDALGNTPLHLAAKYGSFEVMDAILDVEGVEVDPRNRLDGDTPLHCAVRYAENEPEHGAFLAETLVEAGSDARIKNTAGLKPVDLIRGENGPLRETLQAGEMAFHLEEEERARGEYYMKQGLEYMTLTDDIAQLHQDDDDDEGSGSGSGSDDE